MPDYRTRGTCSVNIHFNVVDGLVTGVRYTGGCDGNLKAIASLVEGLPVDKVIDKLGGITCGYKNTSCGDQLARALTAWKLEHPEEAARAADKSAGMRTESLAARAAESEVLS